MCPERWIPPGAAEPVLTEDELAAMLAEASELSDLAFSRGPLPAVLDTDFIRTGLHDQLNKGTAPRSVRTAQDGSLRLFMEYETLAETGRKLPTFADQLGVSPDELRRILNQDWLPNIEVVRLPTRLRELDPRAAQVRDGDGVRQGDPGDFPAAALAALLSPCLLLTHNYKHFGALGVRTRGQGLDGVMAVVAINVGEVHLQAVAWVPALPLQLGGAAMKWATDRIGPLSWVILGVAVVGGICWYHQQPPERQDRIKAVAGQIGTHFMDEYSAAAERAHQARVKLRACTVPKPERRTPVSAILRELALSTESLSAGQLAEILDPALRPSVADIRAFFRAYDDVVFQQVRRGGFVLGAHYRLPG